MALPVLKHAFIELEIPSIKKKIRLRQMLSREEKLVLMAKSAPEETEEQRISKNLDIVNSVKQVLNNAIVTSDVDVDHLAIFDLEYLFVKLRAFSASNIIKVGFIDNEDGETYNFDIDLNKINIQWPENVKSTIKVNDDVVINLKYPDASLYSDEKFLSSQTGNEAAEFLIKNCVKDINGEKTEATDEEWKTFFDELPIQAYSDLHEFVFNTPHLYHVIEYKNKNEKERKIVLDSLSSFFQFV